MELRKISYQDLNARQQESYNYQKLSGILAEYGYTTYHMHNDYHGADFHAVHIDGHVLKVQLKGRVTIHRKYFGREIFIAFTNDRNTWYLYPHDEIYTLITEHSSGAKENGARSIHYIPAWLSEPLDKYKL